MKNKSIFKVGDKVYDIRFGWGEVKKAMTDCMYPVHVDFNTREEQYTFIHYYQVEDFTPLLSFTEYTLQGFSQERPFDPQDVGKWCLTWENDPSYEGKGIKKIIEIDNSKPKFRDSDGVFWDNAKPLTEDQLKDFDLTND